MDEKQMQEFFDREKRVYRRSVEERKQKDKEKVKACKTRFARSMEMMDTTMKMKMTYLSKNPTIKDMKTYYLKIYPHLEKKLEELEPERFPLLWDYLFDRVINQY